MKRRRHVPTKEELIGRLPRGMRPKLHRGTRLELGLVHHINLDVIARGEADEELLWQYAGGALTWAYVADRLEQYQDEMRAQLEVAARLVERYGRTGRVAFTGPDYQLAKDSVGAMDELALAVDAPTAKAAAEWSEATVAQLAASCHASAMVDIVRAAANATSTQVTTQATA